jgi:hypothetical protein
MVERSSFAMARSSASTHWRNACIRGSFGFAAITPATPISIVGSSLANRISFSRSPGRIPLKTISISCPGSSPRQADHALGKIDDLDGLAHVEHVDRNVGAVSQTEQLLGGFRFSLFVHLRLPEQPHR